MGWVTALAYFYDTYAILEYLGGNERFRHFFEKEAGLLTSLNLMEIYYKILERVGEIEAEAAFSATSKYLYEFDLDDVKEAMKLRLKLKREGRNMSYTDALGYYLSMKLDVKFLTGDKPFQGLYNVEFVR